MHGTARGFCFFSFLRTLSFHMLKSDVRRMSLFLQNFMDYPAKFVLLKDVFWLWYRSVLANFNLFGLRKQCADTNCKSLLGDGALKWQPHGPIMRGWRFTPLIINDAPGRSMEIQMEGMGVFLQISMVFSKWEVCLWCSHKFRAIRGRCDSPD